MRPLLLALLLLTVSAGLAADTPTFSLVGRSTHLRLSQGNSSVDVRVGKVFEASAEGPVQGHALPSLASLQPVITNGESRCSQGNPGRIMASCSMLEFKSWQRCLSRSRLDQPARMYIP